MSTSTRVELSERLRKARAGMSQRGMSHQLRAQGYEVSPAMIGKYEAGSTPPPEYLAAICRICYVNPTWIVVLVCFACARLATRPRADFYETGCRPPVPS